MADGAPQSNAWKTGSAAALVVWSREIEEDSTAGRPLEGEAGTDELTIARGYSANSNPTQMPTNSNPGISI